MAGSRYISTFLCVSILVYIHLWSLFPFTVDTVLEAISEQQQHNMNAGCTKMAGGTTSKVPITDPCIAQHQQRIQLDNLSVAHTDNQEDESKLLPDCISEHI